MGPEITLPSHCLTALEKCSVSRGVARETRTSSGVGDVGVGPQPLSFSSLCSVFLCGSSWDARDKK